MENLENLQAAIDAVGEWAVAVSKTLQPAVAGFLKVWRAIEWESLLDPADREVAFRRYAAYYTATHPRGLSWRRLNRPQRRAAARNYLTRKYIQGW